MMIDDSIEYTRKCHVQPISAHASEGSDMPLQSEERELTWALNDNPTVQKGKIETYISQ